MTDEQKVFNRRVILVRTAIRYAINSQSVNISKWFMRVTRLQNPAMYNSNDDDVENEAGNGIDDTASNNSNGRMVSSSLSLSSSYAIYSQ